MRKIKFRVWDNTKQQMVEDKKAFVEEMFDKSLSEWNEIVLMQYTGFDDVDGVEIYEGDIIEHSIAKVFEVKWRESGMWNIMGMKGMRVIGNIYENPEIILDKTPVYK